MRGANLFDSWRKSGWGAAIGGVTLAILVSVGFVALNRHLAPPIAVLASALLLSGAAWLFLRRQFSPLLVAAGQMAALRNDPHAPLQPISGGGPIGAFLAEFNGFIADVGNRLRTEDLQQAETLAAARILAWQRSRLEAVLHAFPEAMVVLDENGCVSFCNSRTITLLGVPDGDVMGKRVADWCTQPEIVAFLSGVGGGAVSGYLPESLELSPEHAPDKTIEVRVHRLFTGDGRGETSGVLVVFRDVTADVLFRKSQEEFVAHVAHELKTPLSVLSMYSETLLDGEGNAPEFRIEAANVIHDEVERLAGLIDNILSITKIDMGSMSLQRERVKLREFLHDAFESVTRSGQRSDLKFHTELPREISAVSVDKGLFRVAVNNLLTNAIKYNRPGGSVTLAVEETEEVVRISVRDTGIGVSSKDRERIFDKFVRSEDDEVTRRPGHGLGLALCREIVHLHGGGLELKSEHGAGSEFVIELHKEETLLQQAI